MLFPAPPVPASVKRRPSLAPLQAPGSPVATQVSAAAAVEIKEPFSPHYLPRGFHNDATHGALAGSPLLLAEDGPSPFDGLNLSIEVAPRPKTQESGASSQQPSARASGETSLPAAPQLRVHDFFHLPPVLVVCLVRHIGKSGEVLTTPQSVEQVVRDLQAVFSSPIPAEQVHQNKNVASAGVRRPPPVAASRNASGKAGAAVRGTSAFSPSVSNTVSSSGTSSGSFQTAHPGSRVSLQFGKAVDVYSTGGSAILNMFIYAVDEATSRPKLMAQVAKDWKEHLASPTGGGESSCMVLLYHKDIVDAARVTGSVNKKKVEAAAAVLETYYSELRLLHFAPQQMSAFHPQETPVRLLERLRTGCAERTERLRGRYDAYRNSKRTMRLDPAIAKMDATSASATSPAPPPAPSVPAATAAAPASTSYHITIDMNTLASSAPLSSPRSSTAAPQQQMQKPSQTPAPTWNVQQLWRLGHDLILHVLQFGLVAEAQAVFQALYVEYYNNSDDYQFVAKTATLDRLGRVLNLFDPRRSGTEPGRSGYPKVLEPSAELVEGLTYLAAGDMACCALLNDMSRCKARYDTFIQVTREKFAEEPHLSNAGVNGAGGDAEASGISRVFQQFFLLQCFLSGLRTFWPLYGLTVPITAEQLEQRQRREEGPAGSGETHQREQQPPPSSSSGIHPRDTQGTTGNVPLATASATPDKPPGPQPFSAASPAPILAPLELDGPQRAQPVDGSGAAPSRGPSSPSGETHPALTYSMIAPPPGFSASFPGCPSGARARKPLLRAGHTADGGSGEEGEENDARGKEEEGDFAIPEVLRRMLHLDDDEGPHHRSGAAEDEPEAEAAAAARHGMELLRLAFVMGTESGRDAVAYLVKLAQGVGFLPVAQVPVEVGSSRPTSKRFRQVRARCLHIAELAISARDCLSYVGDALGFAELGCAGEGKGAVAAFSGGQSESAVGQCSPSRVASADGASPSSARAAEWRKRFHNIEELRTPESGTRLWRLLTVMAAVALRVAGQRRREFNLYTRLALTYLGDDPATTMEIAASRLVPFIRGHGWWHLEYFVRRLYVESADHLIELVESYAKDWSAAHRGRAWRMLFASEVAYALYKECLLFLLHKTEDGDGDCTDDSGSGGAADAASRGQHSFETGSLDNHVFPKRSRKALWERILSVDALVAQSVFNQNPPEYPLEALMDSTMFEMRKASAPLHTPTHAAPHSGASAGVLRAELDENVLLTFTCHCPVDVVPTLVGDAAATIRAVLESRRDWEDPVEPTHVAALAEGEMAYQRASGTLVARFRFTPCHAGFYRVRSIALHNKATHFSFYPQRFTNPVADVEASLQAAAAEATETETGSPTSALLSSPWMDGPALPLQERKSQLYVPAFNFNRTEISFAQARRCASVLLHVPEPTSGIRLRVDAPPDEHCFADSLSFFSLHVDMEEPLDIAEAAPVVADAVHTPHGAHGPFAGGETHVSAAGSSATARDALHDRLKKNAKGSGKGTGGNAGPGQGPRTWHSDCAFETSPGALWTSFNFGRASSSGAAAVAHGTRSGPLRRNSPASRSLLLGHVGGGVAAGAQNRSLTSQSLMVESSLNLKTDASVLALVQVAPPKAPPLSSRSTGGVGRDARSLTRMPGKQHVASTGAVGARGTMAAVTGPTSGWARTLRPFDTPTSIPARSLMLDGMGDGRSSLPPPISTDHLISADGAAASPHFYNTDVTVEFPPETASAAAAAVMAGATGGSSFTPGGSMSFSGLAPSHLSHAHHHHDSHRRASNNHLGHSRQRRHLDTLSTSSIRDPPGPEEREASATTPSPDMAPQAHPSAPPPPPAAPAVSEERNASGGLVEALPVSLPMGGLTQFLASIGGEAAATAAARPASVSSSAALDPVRLALHPAPNLCCADDRFAPMRHPGAAAGTQVRVTIVASAAETREKGGGHAVSGHNADDDDDDDKERHGGRHGKYSSRVPWGRGDDADNAAAEEEGAVGEERGKGRERERHGAIATGVAPHTVVPFDEMAVMNNLPPPCAESAATHTNATLPLHVTGAVSVYPKRECTFQLAVAEEAVAAAIEGSWGSGGEAGVREKSFSLVDEERPAAARGSEGGDHPLAGTRHMVLKLPLLPLFVTRDRVGREAAAKRATVAVAGAASSTPEGTSGPADGADNGAERQRSTVSFTFLRGRETCTATATVSFPFTQAISTSFAFRHFQSRVYCLVSLTNELTRTSLWVRGVLLRILDLMPTYEVVRVSGSYESLLSREWKPKESLSVLYELALCRSFQPTEAVLQHRVHVEVYYSDWHRTYKTTPEAQRITLKTMRLPDTEAGAESVRIDNVSLHAGEAGSGCGHDEGGHPSILIDDHGEPQRPAAAAQGLMEQDATRNDLNTTASHGHCRSSAPDDNSGSPTGNNSIATAARASVSNLNCVAHRTGGRAPPRPSSSFSSSSSSSSSGRSEEGATQRSLDDVGPAVRYNPVSLSILSATCNTYVSQEVAFRSKHLCLFSAVMYAESPWTTRFGAATNYTSASSRSQTNENGGAATATGGMASALSDPVSVGMGPSQESSITGLDTRTVSEAGLMGDAMVDQPSDFRFVAGEPVRFCVRLEPNAHNWPEEADVEEDFFIQLQYDPAQWMVIGKQRERRTLSLMEDVTVNFTAVPLLPPAEAADRTTDASAVGTGPRLAGQGPRKNEGDDSQEGVGTPSVRFAGNSVQDEGVLDTPTIKVFWANPEKAAALPTAGAGAVPSQVLIDVVRFRTSVKVFKKVR